MTNAHKNIYHQAINAMLTLQSMVDSFTPSHESRVASFAVRLAKELHLSEERIELVRLAALVHDIGKVGIPLQILDKNGPLTADEFTLIKTHSQLGYDILKKINFPLPIADIVYAHHEYLDGTGYPRGLKGDEIALESRILTVADIVQSMIEDRPYRKGLGEAAAREEIIRLSNTRLDPVVVNACIAVLDNSNNIFQLLE